MVTVLAGMFWIFFCRFYFKPLNTWTQLFEQKQYLFIAKLLSIISIQQWRRYNMWNICSPYTSSLIVPSFCSSPCGIMVNLYSPLSFRARFLSSRDAVDVKKVILPPYSGLVVFAVFEVIIFLAPNFQAADINGFPGGISVVNITVPPTVAFRGPSGKIPAPLVKPGINSHSLRRTVMKTLQNGPLWWWNKTHTWCT